MSDKSGCESLLAFLFDSDLPVALQVFWKALTFAVAGLLAYIAGWQPHGSLATVLLAIYAAAFILIGLFTKLGDG